MTTIRLRYYNLFYAGLPLELIHTFQLMQNAETQNAVAVGAYATCTVYQLTTRSISRYCVNLQSPIQPWTNLSEGLPLLIRAPESPAFYRSISDGYPQPKRYLLSLNQGQGFLRPGPALMAYVSA